MKKFLLHIAFFAAPIIVLSIPLDIFISNNLKKSNSFANYEYPVWNDIFEGKINADILIHGSSKACAQVNSKMIEDSFKMPTYNLGITGHNFWLQHLRHQLVLKYNKKPKTIIHIVDIGSLIKTKDLFNSNQFLPYMLWNNDIKKATLSYNGFTSIDYHVPLIRYYGNIKSILRLAHSINFPKKNEMLKINGYIPHDIPWNGDFDRAKKKIKFMKILLHKPSIQLFDNYLKECKTNNIKVILVYPPEYIEGQKFEVNRSEVITLFKKFSKKYNIPYHDFSNDPICFKKKFFYNATHLNKNGSELFTRQLIDTLNIKNEY